MLDAILTEHMATFDQLVAGGGSSRLRIFEIFLSAASNSESHYARIERTGNMVESLQGSRC